MKRTAATALKKSSKPTQIQSRQSLMPSSLATKTVNKKSTSANVTSQRKAFTPTQDKPSSRPDSPVLSRIITTETSSDPSKQPVCRKPLAIPVPKVDTAVEQTENLTDQLDFEYTRYLQTMFRRKLAEAEVSDVDDKLTALQKRIVENQNILEKTTTRLKNINFNKEVETLYKLKNPNYGQVLETLDSANCKEYLETINRKMEQSENQLRMKNIELPQGGSAELLDIIKETVAACEKLKANNNLEVPKIIADIKTSNNTIKETLSRCLEMEPEVESLVLEKTSLDIFAKAE